MSPVRLARFHPTWQLGLLWRSTFSSNCASGLKRYIWNSKKKWVPMTVPSFSMKKSFSFFFNFFFFVFLTEFRHIAKNAVKLGRKEDSFIFILSSWLWCTLVVLFYDRFSTPHRMSSLTEWEQVTKSHLPPLYEAAMSSLYEVYLDSRAARSKALSYSIPDGGNQQESKLESYNAATPAFSFHRLVRPTTRIRHFTLDK